MTHCDLSGIDAASIMLYAFDKYGESPFTLIALAVSIISGLIAPGKIRTVIIVFLWPLPLWLYIWRTTIYYDDTLSDFDVWWAYRAFTPFMIGIWTFVTIVPFYLTSRLRKAFSARPDTDMSRGLVPD